MNKKKLLINILIIFINKIIKKILINIKYITLINFFNLFFIKRILKVLFNLFLLGLILLFLSNKSILSLFLILAMCYI
jgi:hypothetical protein